MPMELDLNNQSVVRALVRFTETGAKAGCPFCKGRMIADVSPGERLIILKGMNVGREATVSKEPGLSSDEFLVAFDGDPPGLLTRVIRRLDSFAYLPLGKMPKWLCSLSIDDLHSVDESCLHTATILATDAKYKWTVQALLPIIYTVRSRRLPASGADLWPALQAHGIRKSLKEEFCQTFDFSIELLLEMNGRPAIKKRRVQAMSIGRYLTPGQEEYFGESPGII